MGVPLLVRTVNTVALDPIGRHALPNAAFDLPQVVPGAHGAPVLLCCSKHETHEPFIVVQNGSTQQCRARSEETLVVKSRS